MPHALRRRRGGFVTALLCSSALLLLHVAPAGSQTERFRLTAMSPAIDNPVPPLDPTAQAIATAFNAHIPDTCLFSASPSSQDHELPSLSSGGILLTFRHIADRDAALNVAAALVLPLTEALAAEATLSPSASGLFRLARQSDERSVLSRLVVGGHTASVAGAPAAALTLLIAALRLDPSSLDALELAAVSLQQLGKGGCAEAFHRRAIAQDPSRPRAQVNLGLLLLHSSSSSSDAGWADARAHQAEEVLARALPLAAATSPLDVPLTSAALLGLASALAMRGGGERSAAARSLLRTCIRLDAGSIECRSTAASIAAEDGDLPAAVSLLSSAIRILMAGRAPGPRGEVASISELLASSQVRAMVVDLALHQATLGAWGAARRLQDAVTQAVLLDAGSDSVTPKAVNAVLFLGLDSQVDMAVMRALARQVAATVPPGALLGRSLPHAAGVSPSGRVTVAYLSTDFGQTVMLSFMASALAAHGQAPGGVEVICLSVDGEAHQGSEWRQEVQEGVSQMVELGAMHSEAIAEWINKRRVNIVVFLDGHNRASRLSLLSMAPAPVQVAYRFCSTLGADSVSHFLADRVVAPPELQPSMFHEALVLLPDSYLASSLQKRFPQDPPPASSAGADALRAEVRARHSLPLDAVVLACFNRAIKMDEEIFSVWVSILQSEPTAVLWLVKFPPASVPRIANLARAKGLAASRLVFSAMAAEDEFLLMAFAADAFLDTPRCNAHTTAVYSLWAGRTVEEYAEAARRIARTAARRIKARRGAAAAVGEEGGGREHGWRDFAEVRHQMVLFNASSWARGVEAAYRALWEVHAANSPDAEAPRGHQAWGNTPTTPFRKFSIVVARPW
ncbi:glycosyl transferase family 41-domain-containing protein [Baffinella frigidus]|nr:glycosyl transferase family 41-domain-containing protein [Cryptophyta sp. CCMP2293]